LFPLESMKAECRFAGDHALRFSTLKNLQQSIRGFFRRTKPIPTSRDRGGGQCDDQNPFHVQFGWLDLENQADERPCGCKKVGRLHLACIRFFRDVGFGLWSHAITARRVLLRALSRHELRSIALFKEFCRREPAKLSGLAGADRSGHYQI
jgi:hypothetical protein